MSLVFDNPENRGTGEWTQNLSSQLDGNTRFAISNREVEIDSDADDADVIDAMESVYSASSIKK